MTFEAKREPLSKAEKQEIVDKVAEGLAAQKRPAIDDGGECMWEDHQGNCCAIGMLMTKEEREAIGEIFGSRSAHSAGRQERSIRGSAELYARHLGLEDQASQDFLFVMQGVHDDSSTTGDLAEVLVGVAFLSRVKKKLFDVCDAWELTFPKEAFEN